MILSQESESFNNSECPFCKKFVPYKSRSFCGNIMKRIKNVGRITDVILRQLKYREKNLEIYTSSKSWAESGRKCVKKYENRQISDEEHAIIVANYKERSEKKEEGIFDTNVLIYSSGIDLLCNYFEPNKIKVKIF